MASCDFLTAMLKVLITGGSGLLGLNWALSQYKKNNVVLGLHTREIASSSLRVCSLDIESAPNLVRKLDEISPDLIIHAAGLTNVDRCEREPDLANYINVDLAKNVASAAKHLKIPLVHISTDHLFSGDESYLLESKCVQPINVYGATKAEAELFVQSIYPEALIIRTNFFGWGPSYRQSFSDMVINNLRQKKSIYLFDDHFITPILATELANAIHRLVFLGASGIFNVVGSERISKADFGLKIAQQFCLDISFIQTGKITSRLPARRPKDMSLSNSKFCNLPGNNIASLDDQIKELFLIEDSVLTREIRSL
jgi:dTDP-4-dehydrorhamnose reductase